MKSPRYCYWSIATPAYRDYMQACVDSARACGIFKDFHVLTNRPLQGCESYDLMEFQRQEGLFPVFYLQLAMSKLNYDYFVWVDADTRFRRAPVGLLETVRHSPIHAPLLRRLCETGSGSDETERARCLRLRLRERGVSDALYACGTAFWVVHREAIGTVYEEVQGYWQKTRGAEGGVDFGEAFGFAVQMLCGNPARHVVEAWPGLWREAGNGGAGRVGMVHLAEGRRL